MMMDVAAQRLDPTFNFKAFVHLSAHELPAALLKEPDQPVGIPVAMPDPPSLVEHTARHAEPADRVN